VESEVYERLHWNGRSAALFMENDKNQLDDIKIDTQGDILPQDGPKGRSTGPPLASALDETTSPS
jgi:hypothetical protein